MKEPSEALQILLNAVRPLPPISTTPDAAVGRVLAAPIYAPVDLPLFNQSAMDGFAIRFPASPSLIFNLTDLVQAGDTRRIGIEPGAAVRIFTGALVPPEADAVVAQEDAVLEGNCLRLTEIPPAGKNIRLRGTQIGQGELVLKEGQLLSPAVVGLLSAMGMDAVWVYPLPRVAVLVTGDELRSPGHPLLPGEIYESNGYMLKAALKQAGIRASEVRRVGDEPRETHACLVELLANHDILICTGGISVGDFDFVGEVLKRAGVQQLFYKVAQKPGKPLWMGRTGDKLVAALPGNPGAVLTCFYYYLWPALGRMSGLTDSGLPRQLATLTEPIENRSNRTLMLKAICREGRVTITDKQGSDMLLAFVEANALAIVPPHSSIEAGGSVECILLEGNKARLSGD
jgi:molybdopterin molybdotransferase